MKRNPGRTLARGISGIVAVLLLIACGTQATTNGMTGNPNEPVTSSSDAADGQSSAASGQGGPTMVTGQVVDATGSPVPGVLVVPQSTDQPPQPVPEIAVQTDEQGRYQWTLPPGSYTLVFNAEGFATGTRDVEVQAGQVVTADMTLQRP